MTKKLVWRLGKLPSVAELQDLVKDKIITQEEAREILFNETEESERSIDSFKEEIKFLRQIIDKLGEPKVIKQYITEYIPRYIKEPFYQPYWYWSSGTIGISGDTNIALCGSDINTTTCSGSITTDCSLTNLNTF